MRRLTCEFLHLPVQVNTADAHLLGDHVDIQVGIGEVLSDTHHDLLQQLLVGRLQADVLHLLFQFVGTLILQLQQSAGVKQVLDSALEDVHIEGFDEIGVGTRLKAFETVFLATSGCQQDDRYEIGGAVCLEL